MKPSHKKTGLRAAVVLSAALNAACSVNPLQPTEPDCKIEPDAKTQETPVIDRTKFKKIMKA